MSQFPPDRGNEVTPTWWYRIITRRTVLIALPLLSIIGTYATWGLARRNGLVEHLSSVVNKMENPSTANGTETLPFKQYSHIGAVDHQLATLVAFFEPVFNLEYGSLTLFSIYGLGQAGAVWTLMMMESMRNGNHGRYKAISYVGAVGILFQNTAFAIIAPLWLLLHIITSPVAKPFPGSHATKVLLIPTWDLKILCFSIFLGYIMPSLLMTLPQTKIYPSTRQLYLILWQAFPLLCVGIHLPLRWLCHWVAKKLSTTDDSTPPIKPGSEYLSNVKVMYSFIMLMCTSTHITVIAITLLPSWLVPATWPNLALLAQKNTLDVFLPFSLLSKIESDFAENIRIFLVWDLYIGATAFLLWAILLYRNATLEKTIVDTNDSLPTYRNLLAGERPEDLERWKNLLWKIGIWSLISGPFGVVTMLLWERDSIVSQKIKQGM